MNRKIDIVYGTRSGNSRFVAENARSFCQSAGLEVRLHDIRGLNPLEISRFNYLLLIVSTHGEGDPPDAVEPFYEKIHQDPAASLGELKYAVLALGDSNYRNYCQTGKDLDQRLSSLGARELLEVRLCDLDFELTAQEWIEEICGILVQEIFGKSLESVVDENFRENLSTMQRNNQKFLARIVEKRRLSGEESSKHIFHLRLATGKQRIAHKPGDCLRIQGRNSRAYVDRIIRQLGFNPAASVWVNDSRKLLKEVLINDYELTQLTPLVVRAYAGIVDSPDLNRLLESEEALQRYVTRRDVLDLITDYNHPVTPEQFVAILRSLRPRSYSIASGLASHPEEIHLTVSWTSFEERNRPYKGVASTYLQELLGEGEPIEFEYEPSEAFSFPESPDVPLIMLATSTGIAPFRALLQDRKARGIRGNTWLIFGDRNESADFLYEEEIREYLSEGVLERLDVVFSRDRPEKYYLQDKVRELEAQIVEWLDRGAHIYLCGTKNSMAGEVRASLMSAMESVKKWSSTDSIAWFSKMKELNRYSEDIY